MMSDDVGLHFFLFSLDDNGTATNHIAETTSGLTVQILIITQRLLINIIISPKGLNMSSLQILATLYRALYYVLTQEVTYT